MSGAALKLCIPGPGQEWNRSRMAAVNPCLEHMSASERIQWALHYLPDRLLMTSSFGAQSAVMLHLITSCGHKMPIVLIDTGYLFAETYAFIDQLVSRLNLDLRIYRPLLSPAWQEVRYGKLWESGEQGIRRYNRINKVEPMERALSDLDVGTWFSGLRRSQSDSRRSIDVLQRHGRVVKVHPLADWSNRDVHRYLKEFDLPYHPLWEQGYVSIGDKHTSQPLGIDMKEQDTRFFGLLRECGLHQPENYQSFNRTEIEKYSA